MRLSEVADYILNRYGLQASYVDLDGQTLAAVTVPGADESFALLVKQEGSETVELKCGSLAKFFAKQPAFGPGSYMQDPAWVSVDLASPELNERFFYKTLDAAYQSSRPLERPEQEIYLLDQDGGDYQEEAIPKRSARPDFIQASDYTRELTQAGDAASAMIKKMQASYDYLARDRRESNFYYQGMMMADYEDDFPKKLPIRQLHPVYHDLTVSQLRAYFSWRTNFRRGKYEPAAAAYVYLLASELVCQIGVKDKEDGLRQLKLLFANCLDRQDLLTDWQRKHLLQNYLVYYDFPLETVQEAFKEELQRGRVYQTLLAGQAEGADLYQAICHLSAYQPKNNPMLKKEPEKFYGLLSQVWQEVRRNPYQLLKLLVGEKTVFPVEMFADAVFYSPHPVTEASVEIGAGLSYRCRGGHWISELYWPSSRQKKLLADFMHEFDRLSRLAFKKGRSLKEKPLPPAFKQAISQGIADYQQQLLEAQRPKIKINLASLDQIRADAAETKESLLTEEERELEAQEAAEQAAAQAAAESTAAFSADLNLNETERKLLEALFAGQPYKDFLRQQHQLLSVVVDQINEKLFDEIGDAVIDCDGESAEIVPDYRADLADLLGIEE